MKVELTQHEIYLIGKWNSQSNGHFQNHEDEDDVLMQRLESLKRDFGILGEKVIVIKNKEQHIFAENIKRLKENKTTGTIVGHDQDGNIKYFEVRFYDAVYWFKEDELEFIK